MVVDASLLSLMEASLVDFWGTYALAKGGRHHRLGQGLFMRTSIPHPLFNSVILSGNTPAQVDTAIGLAAESAGSGGGPVLWRVGPSADSATLRARLEQAKLEPHDPFPAMLMDLSDLPPPPEVEGLVIVAATDAEERRAWGRLAIAAFEIDDDVGVAMGDCEATIPAKHFGDQLRFTGLLDGEPVAVSSLVMTRGLAGLYAVGTLPHVRGRGIGAAMTRHAMAEGLRRGAKMVTLQATDMGLPVYKRIGFRTVFHYQAYLQT